jgi:spore maturation protein CgeB
MKIFYAAPGSNPLSIWTRNNLYPAQDEKGEPLKHIRLREFKAPISGAFYLVENLKELENIYKIGKKIICYQTKEDLAEKVKYYLGRPIEIVCIRMAGHERAKNAHTWVNRFPQLFKAIGIGGND